MDEIVVAYILVGLMIVIPIIAIYFLVNAKFAKENEQAAIQVLQEHARQEDIKNNGVKVDTSIDKSMRYGYKTSELFYGVLFGSLIVLAGLTIIGDSSHRWAGTELQVIFVLFGGGVVAYYSKQVVSEENFLIVKADTITMSSFNLSLSIGNFIKIDVVESKDEEKIILYASDGGKLSFKKSMMNEDEYYWTKDYIKTNSSAPLNHICNN